MLLAKTSAVRTPFFFSAFVAAPSSTRNLKMKSSLCQDLNFAILILVLMVGGSSHSIYKHVKVELILQSKRPCGSSLQTGLS